MPIYEYDCTGCGVRSEALVPAGTEAIECPACAQAEARRVFSSFSPAAKLALSGGNKRRQEARNASLHAKAKSDFKAARRRARGGGSGG